MSNTIHEGIELITLYQCNICRTRYNELESAIHCFERGLAPYYPIGCIYGNHEAGNMYEHITFTVATNEPNIYFPHMNDGASWACRDSDAGDSLGESMCAGNSLHLTKHNAKIDPSQPHFKRMVKWLRNQRIDITVWDGDKAITYTAFMRKWFE